MTAPNQPDRRPSRHLFLWAGVLLALAGTGCSGGRDGEVRLAGDALAAPVEVAVPEALAMPVTAGPAPPRDATRGPEADQAEMERLARDEPIAFLERCLERYDREVRGYRAELVKRERVAGRLGSVEHVDVLFREKPFSVRMDWTRGTGLAARLAYVRGRNDDQLLVRPAGWRALAGVVLRDPFGADARGSSRYPITEFGIRAGSLSTLESWRQAARCGDLDVRFGGVKRVPALDNRPCWEMRRVGYRVPEVDGITGATFYFDTETWLQTGSVLTGEGGRLIASYHFRGVELNPEVSDVVFTREGLREQAPARPQR